MGAKKRSPKKSGTRCGTRGLNTPLYKKIHLRVRHRKKNTQARAPGLRFFDKSGYIQKKL
jgi:hypothetical protein